MYIGTVLVTMSQREKRRAVAMCKDCGHVTPVRIWPDESIHSIGGKKCCVKNELQVLEIDASPEPMTDERR